MASEKYILCDSSSLISLTDTCLEGLLKFFTRNNVFFIIPPSVEYEIITRPLKMRMKAYQFSAMKLKKLMDEEVLMKVEAETEAPAKEILELTNSIFFARGKPLHMVDMGEAEMIALANSLKINTLLMDERTTRMLIEAPFEIKDHLEEELRVNIMVNGSHLKKFADVVSGMRVIRSSELVAVAYEKGYFDNFGEDKKKMLEAALYRIKFSGCSVRFDEVEEFLRIEK
ncbi:MAG: hypothetical protein QXL47_04320 [Candidatus Anstonellales archaeon]